MASLEDTIRSVAPGGIGQDAKGRAGKCRRLLVGSGKKISQSLQDGSDPRLTPISSRRSRNEHAFSEEELTKGLAQVPPGVVDAAAGRLPTLAELSSQA